MVSQTTLEQVRVFCSPGISAGLIPEREISELLQVAKKPIPENPAEKKLYTRKEVANQLRISIRQVDRLHDKGLIVYIKAGLRSIRIPSCSITRFLEQRTV